MSHRLSVLLAPRALALLAAFLLPAPAGAADPEEQARQGFEQGLAAARKGNHLEAARAFDASFAVFPHPKTLLASSLEWERAGRVDLAAARLASLLARDDTPKSDREAASARLASLDSKLAILKVSAPEGSRLDLGDQSVALPARVRVAPGRVVAFVTLPSGATRRFEVEAPRGQETHLAVEMAPGASSAPPAPSPPPRAAVSAAPPAAEPASPPGAWRKPLGLGLASAGVIALSAGIYLGASGLAARDRFDADRTSVVDHDLAIRNRLWANVSFAGAALLGGAGAYLFFSTPSTTVSLAGTGVVASGRF